MEQGSQNRKTLEHLILSNKNATELELTENKTLTNRMVELTGKISVTNEYKT